MVSQDDVIFKKSSSGVGLGGSKSATVIASATPTNYFDDVTAAQSISGLTEYRLVYIENGHATEDMEDCDLFLQSDNPNSGFSTVQWGFEPYRYSPYGTFNGTSDFVSEPDAEELRVPTFTQAIWFKTTADLASRGYLINKGGEGSESAGQNDNCSIAMNSNETIRAGFEESDGTDHYVTSALTYNDGKWHLALVSFDGTILQLFIDDMVTPIGTVSTSTVPETAGTNPLVIGRNSRSSANFFSGNLDEGRMWNRALTQDERLNLYNWGIVPANGLVYENKFGDDDHAGDAQTISSETSAPVGVNWLGVTNGPISNTPNIGTLEPGEHVAVWVRWTILPNCPDAKNDFCSFVLQGSIPAGGTGGGGGTPPPAPNAFSFAIVGDWGEEDMTDEVVQLCVNEGVSLVCSVGDNSYGDDGDLSDWLEKMEPIDDNEGSDIKLETAFGNHDNAESAETSTETTLKNHFGYSNTYFSFDMENVHFLFLDNTTETSFSSGSAQHTFANSDLAAARANAAIDWIVVIVHKPMWGASSDHGYNTGSFNQAYAPMFDTHKVDLIGTGHNHNWQITEQVTYNSGSPSSPTSVDATSPYVGGVGRIHVVSGTGGHDSGGDLYSLGSQPGFQEYQSADHNGILKCTLSNNNLTMTCEFIDVNGTVEHSIVINR